MPAIIKEPNKTSYVVNGTAWLDVRMNIFYPQ